MLCEIDELILVVILLPKELQTLHLLQYDNLICTYEIHTAHIIIELLVLERPLQTQVESVVLRVNIRLMDLIDMLPYGMVLIVTKIFSCPIPM